MGDSRSPLGRRQPQTGRPQAAHELAALHLDRTRRNELGAMLLRDVVVIALETAARQSGHVSEHPELVE